MATHTQKYEHAYRHILWTHAERKREKINKLNARTLNAAVHGVPSMNSTVIHFQLCVMLLKSNDVKGFCVTELKIDIKSYH